MINKPEDYRSRSHAADLFGFGIRLGESDIFVQAERNLREEALTALRKARGIIEEYALQDLEFLTALEPRTANPGADPLILAMHEAAHAAGVGPMAAIAGAINTCLATELGSLSDELILENGGDLLLISEKPRRILVHAGKSELSDRLTIEVESRGRPLGICTSSGTFGHSLSFGRADAVMIISSDAMLADAAATAVANRIRRKYDLEPALDFARSLTGVSGVLVMKEDEVAAWGEFKLYPV